MYFTEQLRGSVLYIGIAHGTAGNFQGRRQSFLPGYHMNAVNQTPYNSSQKSTPKPSFIFSAITYFLSFHSRLVIILQYRRLFLLFVAHSLHACRSTTRPTIPLETACRCWNMVWCTLRACRRV